MVNYSIGVRLAWEIASYEARNKNCTLIEIDHIIIGIFSLEKVMDQIRSKSELQYKSLFNEKENLYKVFYSFSFDPVIIRRKLRNILPTGEGLPSGKIYHRSKNCKDVFNIASSICSHILTIKYLFLAILNNRSSYLHSILLDEGINIENLKTEIFSSEYKRN
jgi:hypothetical protein